MSFLARHCSRSFSVRQQHGNYSGSKCSRCTAALARRVCQRMFYSWGSTCGSDVNIALRLSQCFVLLPFKKKILDSGTSATNNSRQYFNKSYHEYIENLPQYDNLPALRTHQIRIGILMEFCISLIAYYTRQILFYRTTLLAIFHPG